MSLPDNVVNPARAGWRCCSMPDIPEPRRTEPPFSADEVVAVAVHDGYVWLTVADPPSDLFTYVGLRSQAVHWLIEQLRDAERLISYRSGHPTKVPEG
jgi:phenylpropionate dioxygenase-like ring-hydroxylating dioxygenase large terminal subunit